MGFNSGFKGLNGGNVGLGMRHRSATTPLFTETIQNLDTEKKGNVVPKGRRATYNVVPEE